jgi:hypothetical protein
MKLRRLAAPFALALAALLAAEPAPAQQKVLRYAFPVAETGLDPARSTTSIRASSCRTSSTRR